MRDAHELSADARALLMKAGPLDDPRPGDASRIWEGFEAKLSIGAAAGGAFTPAAASSGLGTSSAALALKVALPALLVSGVGGFLILDRAAPTQQAAMRTPAATQTAAAAGPASAPSVRPDLEGETELLGDAHAALRRRDARRALVLLRQHERRFARGVLEPERVAAGVFALCQLGDLGAARAQAARFAADYPHSPLAGEVARACPPR